LFIDRNKIDIDELTILMMEELREKDLLCKSRSENKENYAQTESAVDSNTNIEQNKLVLQNKNDKEMKMNPVKINREQVIAQLCLELDEISDETFEQSDDEDCASDRSENDADEIIESEDETDLAPSKI
jgi:hypothetical protein